MNRPDIELVEEQLCPLEDNCVDCGFDRAVFAYIRELEAERKQLIADLAAKFILVPTETWKLVDEAQKIATEERQAQLKRIEHETAFKCAYLAWQGRISGKLAFDCSERVICDVYGINYDSLYSTTWKELNK